MKGYSDETLTKLVVQASGMKLKQIRSTEMSFVNMIEGYTEDGRDEVLAYFVENSPPIIDYVPGEVKYIMMLLLVDELGR